MEMELEGGRTKPLTYKIKAMSRETSAQKATNVLDADLRNYWSTGTNTKEWILLELNEPCLLSHIRIHNKSVLEWEVAAGLRYKPETFVKVRPRCEAPRRDMIYSMNYTPCRYVRLSCLRGSPIAIFFIQLVGISVPRLEPEFQPVVNYLLPQITTHEQDSNDLHFQLLQDITDRLHIFLPQLESELTKYADDIETSTRFLAMLAGPFYPILQIVTEREPTRCSATDSEVSRNSQPVPALTVSSNFEPRKLRSMSPFPVPTSRSIVFRPDAVFTLLRKAFADDDLGAVCKVAAKILHHLAEATSAQEASFLTRETSSLVEAPVSKSYLVALSDCSELFGDQFLIPVVDWNPSYINVLDIGAVEEGILHVLYACASQSLLCSKLAVSATNFWLTLPLIQALLPALRPANCILSVDDTFSQWMQPFVQQALLKIISTLSSPAYHPLLHGCAGYLSSFSPSHAKTACVLIDLCSSSLAPWMPRIIAKIDLAVELLEDLLGVIQGEHHSLVRVRAALKYLVLALSGYMDDVLAEYKEAKLKVLFLVEMLETFLEPAFSASQSMISSAEFSYTFLNAHENTCAIALQVIRAAVKKPSVLPSLEQEWQFGSVPPSVLLSILDPHLQLLPDIDFCKPCLSKPDKEILNSSSSQHASSEGNSTLKYPGPDDGDGMTDGPSRLDILEDASLLFAPEELRNLALLNSFGNVINGMQATHSDPNHDDTPVIGEEKTTGVCKCATSDSGFSMKYFSLHLNHTQLLDYEICQSRASEFQRLALELHSQNNVNLEGHNAAIDAMILSAECYINPFMISVKEHSVFCNQVKIHGTKYPHDQEISELRKALGKGNCNLETISHLERKRDKVFVQILLEAAEMDRSYYQKVDGDQCPYGAGSDDESGSFSVNNDASVDAITLVRRNQELLCNFLIHQLQREQQSLHETLMQSLVFLLHSATKLLCSPENVIDIILGSAEQLNRTLMFTLHQYKEGNLQLNPERIYRVQRHWMILQSLVIASSGGSSRSNNVFNVSGCQYSNLILPSAWICKISTFSSCTFPLVRYLGWMAVSRNAKGYLTQRLFLASNLSQLTNLLSIFADDLGVLELGGDRKEVLDLEDFKGKPDTNKADKFPQQKYQEQSFAVMYPDLSKILPDMQKEFEAFRETILEAVSLQLRSLASTAVPDILCWFSDLCLSPFLQKANKTRDSYPPTKGYHAKNAKAIILFVLEAIIGEHMEAIIPEMPRLVQVLGSLCKSSYCDTPFLKSILRLLKPIISYSLSKNFNEEKYINGDSCLDFESLCFDELFTYIRQEQENIDSSSIKVNKALIIFILASIFCDLSFDRKREVIQSSVHWVDFPALEPTTAFYDYLSSFQQLLQSCNVFLVENLRVLGLIPMPHTIDVNVQSPGNNGLESNAWFPDDFCYGSKIEEFEKTEGDISGSSMGGTDTHHLSLEEIEGFCGDLHSLISNLNKSIESCWNLHPQLSRSLAVYSSQCLMYSRCLFSVMQEISGLEEYNTLICKTFDEFFAHWKNGIEGLAENIPLVQENSCWEVASTMVDCLLKVPAFCSLDNVVSTLSSVIENIMSNAPKISWRLQTDRWLSNLFSRGILMHESGIFLIDLISKMLSHPEPEQRFTALLHLGRLFGLDVNGGWVVLTSPSFDKLASQDSAVCISESVLSQLVSNTWDQISHMASVDTSLHLRTVAMALLVHYIPFANLAKLQSFLETADTLFQALGSFAYPMGEGLFAQLSLALIAGACLYCPAEYMSLVPQSVWRYLETLGGSKSGRVGEMEKRICQALCKVKNDEEEAKEALKEALSSCQSKEFDPEFGNTRESVLQVLANVTSVQAYFDVFAEKMDQEAGELEEAELEMDILQKELPLLDINPQNEVAFPSSDAKDGHRLQQIKDGIRSIEKSRIKEEIIERRQKKLLLRHRRQKYLEEAALREAERLQELDRQRTSEMEKDIERQRMLELERAKTNELRYNLDLEKEKQTQKELQRELEQVESGSRPPRREFSSSTHSSRPRDRYRDRENGRSNTDVSLRGSNTGLPPDMSVNTQSLTTTPTVVLSGSRTFPVQPPTILQARDRTDECSSSYEENFDGSKDSGDTGSTGDPELGPGFDGLAGGFGSQRHGSRGSKSRQILERRERDGRREGKWERKHS
ncbi:uncharacterized protein LOC110702196 isoform X2 [Chenopodium quinoa]|uniref:uncharacterized protein LOC110702196 isoform X2 n=1 Tax=Chenopodium quinoa TaxID=63459 RepID=UPI000B770A93|nr:uncharacterized protein LOC110702196 isoform X2 [Chenopodium quinoa]